MTKKQIEKIIKNNDKTKIYEWKKKYRHYRIRYRLKYDDLWFCWKIEKYYILHSEYEAYKVSSIKADYYLGL